MSVVNQDSERVYRWQFKAVLFNFARLVYLIPLSIVILVTGSCLVLATGNPFARQQFSPTGIVVLIVMGIAILAALWFFVVFPLVRLSRSYLKLSPEGLEFCYWPTYRIRATWQDVERIGKYKVLGAISYDALYLRKATPVGDQSMMNRRRKLGMSTQHFVLLSDFRGWPDGELADQLRRYVPLLFVEQTGEAN